MPKMSPDEVQAFLVEPGKLCRIATLKVLGAPHVTPAWFIYEDGRIYMTPRAESSWLANIRRDARVALTIDEDPLPYRKVTVEGLATVVRETGDDDIWRDQYRRIARRYSSPEGAEAYIQRTIDQPRGLIAIPLEGSLVRSWRMPVGDENGTGMWHKRYYLPGTKMAGEVACD
ncbi:MAG: pyridoxamine 5'-phosphate oxidase family protein [Tepidiformaceae bacterium]